MSEEQNEEGGFFEGLLMVAGGITGAVQGWSAGEWGGMIFGALILGGIGRWVGAVADFFVKLLVLIAILMINATIRRFAWEVILAIFN